MLRKFESLLVALLFSQQGTSQVAGEDNVYKDSEPLRGKSKKITLIDIQYTQEQLTNMEFLPHMTDYCLAMYKDDKSTRQKMKGSDSDCKLGRVNNKNCYRGECPFQGTCVCCPPIIDEYITKYEEAIQSPLGAWTGPACTVWKPIGEILDTSGYTKWRNALPENEFEKAVPRKSDEINVASIIQSDGDLRNYQPVKDKEKECKTAKSTCYRGLCKDGKCTDCFVYDGTVGFPGKYHGDQCDIFIPDSTYDANYEASVCTPGSTGCENRQYCTKAGKCSCSKSFVGARCEKPIALKNFCPNDCSRDNRHGKCKKLDSGQKRCLCAEGFDGLACEKPFQCLVNGIDLCEEGKCKKATLKGVKTQLCICEIGVVATKPYCAVDKTLNCGKAGVCEGEGSKCIISPYFEHPVCNCGPGRFGESCEFECEPGYFGRNCGNECGKLKHMCRGGPSNCDKKSGECKACEEGYKKSTETKLNFCNASISEEFVTRATLAFESGSLSTSNSADEEKIQELKDEYSALHKTFSDEMQRKMMEISNAGDIGSVRTDALDFTLGSVVATLEVAFPADEAGDANLNQLVETGLAQAADDGFNAGLGDGYALNKDSIKTSEVRLRSVRNNEPSNNAVLIGGVVGTVAFVVVVTVVVVKVKSNQTSMEKKKKKGKSASKTRSRRGNTVSNLDMDGAQGNVKEMKSAVSKKSKSKKTASSTA